MKRSLAVCALVRGALICILAGAACAPRMELEVTNATFNPKFSLDRVPVPEEPDPTLGTFRRGPGQSASYVYPEVDEAHRLMQGECFWLAHDSDISTGDFVSLNWEAVLEFQPDLGGGLRFAPGDNQLTLCRLDHPVDRRNPMVIEGSAPPEPVVMTLSADRGNLALAAPGPEAGSAWAIRQQNDLAWLALDLTEFDSRAPNPDRVCIAAPMTDTPVDVVHDFDFYEGLSDEKNLVEACSQSGRGIRPSSDSSYIVHWGDPTDLGPDRSALWLRPNLMLVDGRDRLVRPMNPRGSPESPGAWSWSTPILEQAPHRWGENFSPRLTVQAVRLLTRDAAGNEEYLDSVDDIGGNGLCIRRPDSPQCDWTCPGEVHDGKLVFDLTGVCLNASGGEVEVALTPTYDKGQLANSGGDAITEPLVWSIEPAGATPSRPHYIEFDVAADLGRMALMAEPAYINHGNMAQGDTRRAEVRLRNIGAKSVRVDALGFDPGWGDPADFDARVLDNPKLVPVPVELEDQGTDHYELRQAEDWKSFPVIETSQGTSAGGDYTLGRLRSFEKGAEFTVNEHRVVFDGSLALYDDPKADFTADLSDAVRRPFGVVAYRLREPPFTLLPGESVLITVDTTPSAYGERKAMLNVEYSDALDPSNSERIEVPVYAYGMWGPDAYALPEEIYYLPSLSLPATRGLLLSNSGDMQLQRTTFGIVGRDAIAFAVVSGNPVQTTIDAGDAEIFRIEMSHNCGSNLPADGFFRAEMLLRTSEERFEIPISAPVEICGP